MNTVKLILVKILQISGLAIRKQQGEAEDVRPFPIITKSILLIAHLPL